MRPPCTRWWRRRKILSLSPLVAGRACSQPIFPAGVANAAHKALPKRSVGHRGRWYYRGGEYNGFTGVRSDHGGQGTAYSLRAQARIAAQRAYWSGRKYEVQLGQAVAPDCRYSGEGVRGPEPYHT